MVEISRCDYSSLFFHNFFCTFCKFNFWNWKQKYTFTKLRDGRVVSKHCTYLTWYLVMWMLWIQSLRKFTFNHQIANFHFASLTKWESAFTHDVMQNDSQPFTTFKNHSKINIVVSHWLKITHIHIDRILISFTATKCELTFTHVFMWKWLTTHHYSTSSPFRQLIIPSSLP